jgi:hypothetical protein
MERLFMNKWMELTIVWPPFLLITGVWLYFSRRNGMLGRGSSSGSSMIELYEQQVEETRRMNANLERIAASLEKRESTTSAR